MKVILTVIIFFYYYHLIWFLLSLSIFRRATFKPEGKAKSRFAVLFPAHNEEGVIKASIQSLKQCYYPKKLFDLYVIADNCTDRTARLARQAGAIVLERQDPQKGKQHALKWAFTVIDLEKYDAVVILDADNRVDPNFLNALDRELKNGHQVVQGYLETLNPSDSWVSSNYAYMFWYLCRLNMVRSKLGLSSWLGGTGFCISTSVLKKVGWNVDTLTDDVEYTCELILKGEKVKFAPDAVVYDQKPRTLDISVRQRVRWIRGQTQVIAKYLPGLVFYGLKAWARGDIREAFQALDAIMWVPMHLIILTSVLISLAFSGWKYILGVLIYSPAIYILTMLAEKVKNKHSWVYLITAGLFFFTWLPVTAYGVITYGQKDWWRTPH